MSGERNSFDNFEELYTNCYWLVYRYVRHMVEKDLAAAEDVTQEVFLVAYQKWQEVRRHPNQKGFLLLTAKNKLKKLQPKKEYKIEKNMQSTFSHRTRSPATDYSFVRVHITGTLFPLCNSKFQYNYSIT